jgi:hypothetical protein
MVNINLLADGCILNLFATGDDGCFHCMLFHLVFWLIVVNPGFITCDDPLQKVVTFSAIMSQVAGTNV